MFHLNYCILQQKKVREALALEKNDAEDIKMCRELFKMFQRV